MNDTAIAYSAGGNLSVDTYGMDGASVGMTDQGEPLYDFGGVTMTAEQAEANSDYFLAEDDGYDHEDGYGNSSWDQEETLPEPYIEGLNRINDVLGGGAANFIADELLGMGDSRMAEVLAGTNIDREEVQSYAHAVVIDMASHMNMDHNMLMDALGEDINTVRSLGSDRGMQELHEIISDAVAGNYHDSMTRWDRLRGVLNARR